MTMEERIEATAKSRYQTQYRRLMKERHGSYPPPWDAISDDSKASWRGEIEAGLRVAFPELFDGSGWIAPWELSEDMHHAMFMADGGFEQWAAARDAHLKPNAPTP